MTPDEYQILTERLLEEGVPPGVVARSLELDPELVKATQKNVRVANYGTDDMTDYTEQLLWDALDAARKTLETGSAAEKSRVMGVVLGKQVALSARRTPQAVRNASEEMLERLRQMREGGPVETEMSQFVVRAPE